MRRADFSSFAGIKEAFSLEAVSDEFYKEFEPKFRAIADSVIGIADEDLKQDLALLFVIRVIFLGFVQKKGWLGNNQRFLQDFWEEYKRTGTVDEFYRYWLEPLFFEALNQPPGRKVAYGYAPFSKKTQEVLQMAPYLNGELFKRKQGVDDQGLWIPDCLIGDFFDFLFQYNFTVEENELYDEDLELNPEFLGIIFERITNMDQGAVYTPRVEVDFMCRLSLVKWLEKTTKVNKEDLYHLFFREGGVGAIHDDDQKQGDFSPNEIRMLIDKLENVTICDPAAGSGAFEVGMLQVLDQVLNNLYSRNNTPQDLMTKAPGSFERKKAIIARSLYGVEVKRWAVWINHLRLWLTLFVDMPDDSKYSVEPLLPNLAFKVCTGDSLVQRIGGKSFHIQYTMLSANLKRRISQLRNKKVEFFYNKCDNYRSIEHEELAIFRDILDEEICERRNKIHNISLSEGIQESMFIIDPEQTELDFNKENEAKRVKLEDEIKELQEQKLNLKEERPFIWNIEFAEIFYGNGGFDIIIGNPPYVRQEEISDPYNKLDPQSYKEALAEMLRLDFPEYFINGRRHSRRSDLYTYFYIRSLRLLNRSGVHVFICSNSWLDVGYGAWLQEFFLRQAPLQFVIDNHARRSFARADINTVITVAGAPKEVEENHVVRFVAFKKPFEDVVLTENLLDIETSKEILKNDHYRVFPITTKELLQEGSELIQNRLQLNDENNNVSNQLGDYIGDKWGGKYLRAPDIFFTILEKGKDKLVRLGYIAEVRRGFTTGANDFFYLEPLGPGSRPGLLRVRNGAGWEGEIEEEYLKPVAKSPREFRSIVVNPEQLKNRIFMCNKSKEELKNTYALKYIEWGEQKEIVVTQGKDKGNRIKGYHNLETTRNRRYWWSLGERDISNLHINYMINDIGRTFIGDFYTSDNFHDIFLLKDYAVALNSIIFYLFQNITGRTNFGGGLIKIQTYELMHMKILNTKVSNSSVLLNYNFKSIFEECGIDPESDVPIAEQEPNPLPGRKALDDIVFDALGLTKEERKEVYRAVCQLVWERISKARSVTRNG
jgi:hypothetical protein